MPPLYEHNDQAQRRGLSASAGALCSALLSFRLRLGINIPTFLLYSRYSLPNFFMRFLSSQNVSITSAAIKHTRNMREYMPGKMAYHPTKISIRPRLSGCLIRAYRPFVINLSGMPFMPLRLPFTNCLPPKHANTSPMVSAIRPKIFTLTTSRTRGCSISGLKKKAKKTTPRKIENAILNFLLPWIFVKVSSAVTNPAAIAKTNGIVDISVLLYSVPPNSYF